MNIQSNGSRWAGEEPATIAELMEVLKVEILDPVFEAKRYGCFFYKLPDGTYQAGGNFQSVSHVFNINGTLEELTPLKEALEAARKRPEYRKALKEYKASEKAKRDKYKGSAVV